MEFHRSFKTKQNLNAFIEHINNEIDKTVSDNIKVQFALKLVIQELILNAYHYGRKNDQKLVINIKINLPENAKNKAELTINDNTMPFNPLDKLATLSDYHQIERPGGKGLILVQSFTQNWEYEKTDKGNMNRLYIAS